MKDRYRYPSSILHDSVSVSAILSCRPFFILIFLPYIKMRHYGFSRKSIWKTWKHFLEVLKVDYNCSLADVCRDQHTTLGGMSSWMSRRGYSVKQAKADVVRDYYGGVEPPDRQLPLLRSLK